VRGQDLLQTVEISGAGLSWNRRTLAVERRDRDQTASGGRRPRHELETQLRLALLARPQDRLVGGGAGGIGGDVVIVVAVDGGVEVGAEEGLDAPCLALPAHAIGDQVARGPGAPKSHRLILRYDLAIG